MLKHKYRAIPTERDGIKFGSRAEARYYDRLQLAKQSGDLLFFLRQVPFHLPGSVTYRADFMEFWKDGEVKIIDVKGFDTPQSKQKRKQVEAIYPVKIEIVKNTNM